MYDLVSVIFGLSDVNLYTNHAVTLSVGDLPFSKSVNAIAD